MREPEPRSSLGQALREGVAEARHRELAIEHLLFHALSFVERHHPGLIDHLEASLPGLGDHADDDTKDDEAVRAIARRFLDGLRRLEGR